MGLFGKVAKGIATGGITTALDALKPKGVGFTPNIQPQLNELDASAKKQSDLATALTPKLAALNAPYQQNRHDTGVDFQNESREASNKFLEDIGQSSDKLGENLSQTLMRRTMASQPAMQQQLRESLAATGGLHRGAADQAFMQQGQQMASQLFEGNQDIINQQMKSREDAMKMAYSVDQNLIADRLGIDQDTLAQIYASGRQDLIQEANSLLGIEQTRSAGTLSALGFKDSAELAKASANATAQNQFTNALLGLGGQIAGSAMGSRGTVAPK